jgi:hypothetical protein
MPISLDTSSTEPTYTATIRGERTEPFGTFPEAFTALWRKRTDLQLQEVPEDPVLINSITRHVPAGNEEDPGDTELDYNDSCDLATKIRLLMGAELVDPFEPDDPDTMREKIELSFRSTRTAQLLRDELGATRCDPETERSLISELDRTKPLNT